MAGRKWVIAVALLALAAAVMSAAVLASSRAIAHFAGTGFLTRLADLALSIPLGLVVLYAVARALRIEELEMARRALASPIARRLSLE